MPTFATKTSLPRYLRIEQDRIENIARSYGLDFFPAVFEMLTYDQMNEIAAYGGFPNRYPHWRFGMEYERLSKSYEYGLSKIYEMVINSNPSYAYLLEGNSLTDQKLVMCHVYGHVDFFKNNFTFRATDLDSSGRVVDPARREENYRPNRRWVDKFANHGAAVRRVVDRHGIQKVEEFIDTCLSLENLVDPWSPFVVRRREAKRDEEPEAVEVPRLRAKDYMEDFINPEDYIEEQKKKIEAEREKEKTRFPADSEQDVLLFLIENAPLERWERTILSVVREEAYYFVPQMQTKVENEGWACLTKDALAFTDAGLLTMDRLVAGDAALVCDGEMAQRVYDRHVIRNHETITLRTRRGLKLSGSTNHRVLLADRTTWRRLDELALGDRVALAGGWGLTARDLVPLSWEPQRRWTLDEAAGEVGIAPHVLHDFRRGRQRRHPQAAAIAEALELYDRPENQALSSAWRKRRPIAVPDRVTPNLASFLGYLVGDGHISRVKRNLGLTTGDEIQACEFARLGRELFGLLPSLKWDDGRWRVLFHSEDLADFLVEAIGLTTGPSARQKRIPDVVLRSPDYVVRAFIRAYFDCDAYVGSEGVILSTSSEALSEQVQVLLLNYNILSRRRACQDGCWQVRIRGAAAARYSEKFGFGLDRKQRALEAYVENHRWFLKEEWEDEVVALERGRADVYDISVERTHRYVANGFINHNSFWHSKLMTEKVADTSEIVDYAENNAAVMSTASGRLNPYKLGVELYRSIEERWNKGQFGREWEECDDLDEKKNWDLRLGLGREKIFEVRALYNDVTFIDEFLTPDFAMEHELFTFGWSNRNERYEIESREFKAIKEKLLFQLTNFGNPFIYVEDANWENRGELLLRHDHRGVDLRMDYARETLSAMVRVWKRPVCLATIIDGKKMLLRYDGKEHSVRHDAP